MSSEPNDLEQGEIDCSDNEADTSTEIEEPTNAAVTDDFILKVDKNTPIVESDSNNCAVCKEKPFKYKCPRCFTKTCSLPCTKKHKSTQNCSGDKPKFQKLNRFYLGDATQLTVLQDYRFLEHTTREHKRRQRIHHQPPNRELEHLTVQPAKFRQRLIGECKKRHIHLRLMPPSLERARINDTKWEPISDSIMWTFELHFAHYPIRVRCNKVPDSVTLNTIVGQFLQKRQRRTIVHEPIFNAELLPPLLVDGDWSDQWVVIRRVEGTKDLHQKLEPSSSLIDSVRNTVVIEYPTFILVQKSRIEEFIFATPTEIKNAVQKSVQFQQKMATNQPGSSQRNKKKRFNKRKGPKSPFKSNDESSKKSKPQKQGVSDASTQKSQVHKPNPPEVNLATLPKLTRVMPVPLDKKQPATVKPKFMKQAVATVATGKTTSEPPKKKSKPVKDYFAIFGDDFSDSELPSD